MNATQDEIDRETIKNYYDTPGLTGSTLWAIDILLYPENLDGDIRTNLTEWCMRHGPANCWTGTTGSVAAAFWRLLKLSAKPQFTAKEIRDENGDVVKPTKTFNDTRGKENP